MQKEVIRTGPFKDFIADAVRVGDTIYLSGQVSVDDTGKPLHEGDLAGQVKVVYDSIKSILDKYGATMDHIIDEMWLVIDMQDTMTNIEKVFAVRQEAYGRSPEVSQTMVQVAGLVMPELLIEIKVVARI